MQEERALIEKLREVFFLIAPLSYTGIFETFKKEKRKMHVTTKWL